MPERVTLQDAIEDRLIRIRDDIHYRPKDAMRKHWNGEVTSLEWVLKWLNENEPQSLIAPDGNPVTNEAY